jgi:hypothetical protein
VLPLQRRYTAPLMDLLARGQTGGEIRADVPLRLLRPMVFGPMEHILWEAVATKKPIDIDTTARALATLLWGALRAPAESQLARAREVAGAAQGRVPSGSVARTRCGKVRPLFPKELQAVRRTGARAIPIESAGRRGSPSPTHRRSR